ncbi:MAG: C39 family peptidase [Leucobacter sp.]
MAGALILGLGTGVTPAFAEEDPTTPVELQDETSPQNEAEEAPDSPGESPTDEHVSPLEDPEPEAFEPVTEETTTEEPGVAAEPSLRAFDTAPVPAFSGTLQSGESLTANAGTWRPSAAKLEYQWLRDGKNITGATGRTYTVRTADRGRRVSVSVRASLAGYETVTVVSTAKLVPQKLTTAKPAIVGAEGVGKTLTAVPGSWTSGTSFTYQWYRDGKRISGATSAKYRVSQADQCSALTVRAWGRQSGYLTASKLSPKLNFVGCPAATGNKIKPGQRISAGGRITSANGKHALTLGGNGTLTQLNHGRARWKVSKASGSTLVMLANGELALRKGGKTLWRSKTQNKSVKYAQVRPDGDLVIYNTRKQVIWSLSTGTKTPRYRANNWGVPYLSQVDSRWSGRWIGRWQFGPVGCVPTAFAMAAQSYGVQTDPYTVGLQMHRYGDLNRTEAGAGGKSIVAAAGQNGLKATALKSKSAVAEALKNNQPVIALVRGPAQITRAGSTHAVVLTGYSGGHTNVKNPWGAVNASWKVSTLWNWQSWHPLDRNAGAVFWAIG